MEWADLEGTDGAIPSEPGSGRLATSPAQIAALDAALALGPGPSQLGTDPRLTTFRALLAPTLAGLARALVEQVAPADLLAAFLRIF